MPIIGLTRRQDVQDNATHRLVLGKLRKGGPKTAANRPGPDLDYFRFTSERPEVMAAFRAAYGDKPQRVDAYLPFPEMERNWPTSCEEHDAGGLVHRCDGQVMHRWRVGDGSYQDGEKPCPYFTGEKKRTDKQPGCKQVGHLYLVLPELLKAGFVGLVSLETHAKNDLISITASLLDIEGKAGGRLTGILMTVLRVKETISTPAWKEEDRAAGKRNRTVKDLVKIVAASEWVMAQLERANAEQMALASGAPLQLEAKHATEDPDEYAGYDDDLELEEDGLDEEDFIDGEATEAGEEIADEGFVPPTPRELAIAGLRLYASKFPEQAATPEQRRAALGNVNVLVSRNAERKAALLDVLFGLTDEETMTLGQASALVEWIKAKKVTLEDKTVVWTPSTESLAGLKLLFPPEAEG